MKKKYIIWNNKGGVGKTFLTYLLSTEYAKKNPDKNVVIADMCPQANISEILLGGDGIGEQNLQKISQQQKTVADYIKFRYDKSRFAKLGTELNFFISVNQYNKDLPENIYLLSGDVDLDLCANIIQFLSTAPEKNAWVKSRSMLLELLEVFEDAHNDKENIFFIDCNPSFATYTEISILAGNRLIIPCNSDSSSLRGLENVFRIIYGNEQDAESPFNFFSNRIKELGLSVPKVDIVLNNKTRTYTGAAKAFQATSKEIEKIIQEKYKKNQDKFIKKDREVIYNIKDGNTIANVINFSGKLLSEIKVGTNPVYEEKITVNKEQKDSFSQDINEIVDIL